MCVGVDAQALFDVWLEAKKRLERLRDSKRAKGVTMPSNTSSAAAQAAQQKKPQDIAKVRAQQGGRGAWPSAQRGGSNLFKNGRVQQRAATQCSPFS